MPDFKLIRDGRDNGDGLFDTPPALKIIDTTVTIVTLLFIFSPYLTRGDKQHIHNHFVLNYVSFVDGKKYNDCKASYALMRRTSDELCLAHGLSVVHEPERGRTMSYDTWEAEQSNKPTWYGQIRQDVDSCITRSLLFSHFLDNLRKQGYAVKEGKYLAVRPPGKERFVRPG